MTFQGFFATFVKTANHKAPVDREVCLSSRAWIGAFLSNNTRRVTRYKLRSVVMAGFRTIR